MHALVMGNVQHTTCVYAIVIGKLMTAASESVSLALHM